MRRDTAQRVHSETSNDRLVIEATCDVTASRSSSVFALQHRRRSQFFRDDAQGVAMPKNESTAVNELIDLVQSGKTPDEPGDELFRKPATSTRVNPPRVTTTVPPMRGAGEVAPLPRRRSANGTEGPMPP